jgi:hypothetical protein
MDVKKPTGLGLVFKCLVAWGGIEPPTQGFSRKQTYYFTVCFDGTTRHIKGILAFTV